MKIFFFLLLFVVFSDLVAQDISKINLAHRYNPGAEVNIRTKLISTSDNHLLFVNVLHVVKKDFDDDYGISYEVFSGYNSQTVVKETKITTENLIEDPNDLIYKIAVPKINGGQLFVLKITNLGTSRDFYFDIPLIHSNSYPADKFLLQHTQMNAPIFKEFATVNDSLTFLSGSSSEHPIYGFRYSFEFDAALPPMVTNRASANRIMEVDSSFIVKSNDSFSLNKEGLYFFQSDTNSVAGTSILIRNNHYPKLTTAEELIEPVVYISTRLEFRNLTQAENKKSALDRFWIKVTGNMERAKRTIRYYYKNVEQVNSLFTNYKEGWKTDKGMILITFGAPDEVYRNGIEEVWIYNRTENSNKFRFNFSSVKNIFSGSHEILKRERGHEKYWYRTIDLWRKGRKGI